MRLEVESGISFTDRLDGLIGSCSSLDFDIGCRIKDLIKDMLTRVDCRKRGTVGKLSP